MKTRRIVLTATATLVVLGGTLGTDLGAAAPRQSAAPAKAATLPTTDRYVVKLVSKIAPSSGNIMVSSNGQWAVTNAGDLENISYISQLINVTQGKVVGTLDGTGDGAYVVGVDNAGIVFGRGDAEPGSDEVFTWNGHTLVWTALSPTMPFGCDPNDPPIELGLQFNSVNGAGDAVGGAFWRCPDENIDYTQAIAYSPQHGIEFSGTFTSGGKKYHPYGTWTIDDAGIISGVGILPTDAENNQESEWTDNEAAVPQSIAANVGQSLVYPARTNALWHGGDFVGGTTSYYNGPESLYVGGTDSETITPIPGTTGVNQDPPPFTVQALSITNLVVGTRAGTTATAPTSAGVWSVGSPVTPLTSLLATSTKDHLLTAMAIDTKDEIFGTATTSTAAGAQQYLYEAVIAHPRPAVSLKSPKSGKSYKKNAKVKASYSCKAGKGTTLKSCKGTKADHHAISTSKVGKHSFTVVATDADGEKTTKTVHYKVKA